MGGRALMRPTHPVRRSMRKSWPVTKEPYVPWSSRA